VKLPNETDHEVMEKILIQQQHSSNRKKDLLVKKFIVTNSPVNISMKKIFNQAFRKE
jgi:hypothetical protein